MTPSLPESYARTGSNSTLEIQIIAESAFFQNFSDAIVEHKVRMTTVLNSTLILHFPRKLLSLQVLSRNSQAVTANIRLSGKSK